MSSPNKNATSEDDDRSINSNADVELDELSVSLDFDYYPGTERLEYDFTTERINIFPTNLVESTAYLIKGSLGAGVLGMHEAFMNGGLWTSLVTTWIIGFIVYYTTFMLVRSAHDMYVKLRVPRLSYPDLAEAALACGYFVRCRKYSKVFRHTVEIFLFTEMCGNCCVYEIMIARTLKQVLEMISPTVQSWHLNIRIYILIFAIPLFLLSWIRNLKHLAFFAFVADICIGVCVIMTLYYSISEVHKISERSAWKSFVGFFRFIGICIYSVEGVGITMPVENNMKTPKYFNRILQIAMPIVIVTVTIIGFFGYVAWGEGCKTPITIHMPQDIISVIFQFLVAAMLSVTFAIHLWVPFRIMWYYISKKHRHNRELWERFYKAIYVIAITLLTLIIPDLNILMSILGSFLLVFIGFVFPAVIEILITWNPMAGSKCQTAKNICIILLGLIMFGGAVYSLINI